MTVGDWFASLLYIVENHPVSPFLCFSTTSLSHSISLRPVGSGCCVQ